MTKTKIEIAEARRKEIEALVHRAKSFAKLNPHMDIARLLDGLAGVAKKYLELDQVLIKIIVEGMMTNDDGTLIETFKPPCQVCATTKRLASEALGVTPFWEDNAKELNNLIRKGDLPMIG